MALVSLLVSFHHLPQLIHSWLRILRCNLVRVELCGDLRQELQIVLILLLIIFLSGNLVLLLLPNLLLRNRLHFYGAITRQESTCPSHVLFETMVRWLTIGRVEALEIRSQLEKLKCLWVDGSLAS